MPLKRAWLPLAVLVALAALALIGIDSCVKGQSVGGADVGDAQTTEGSGQPTDADSQSASRYALGGAVGTEGTEGTEGTGAYVSLDVPLILQLPELPTGCEATSVAMLLNYAGVEVSKTEIADAMPTSRRNPERGFVGDPYTESGYTIYPPAFEDLINAYLGSFVDMSGCTVEDIRQKLDEGAPVVSWVSDGASYLHCVCLTGYDGGGFLVNDPLEGYSYWAYAEFQALWEHLGCLALSY